MKKIILILLITVTMSANPTIAWWTGRSKPVTTVTGRSAISCEYEYAGQKFWKTFVDTHSCPPRINVE